MKKRIIALPLSVLLLSLASCQSCPTCEVCEEPNTDNNPGGDTQEPPVTEPTKEEKLDEFLDTLKDNVTFDVTDHQVAVDIESGEAVGEITLTKSFKYLGGDSTALEVVSEDEEGSPTSQIIELGEDGNAYEPYLNYDNTKGLKMLVNEDKDQPYNYYLDYSNPFILLSSKDFDLTNDSEYKLNLNKANYIFKTFAGVEYALKSATLSLNEGSFTKFNFEVSPFEGEYEDEDYNYYQVNYSENLEISFKDIGKTVVTGVEPVEAKEGNEDLETALKGLGTNYTITFTRTSNLSSTKYVTKIFYANDQIFYLYNTDNVNSYNDALYKIADDGYYHQYGWDGEKYALDDLSDYPITKDFSYFEGKFSSISKDLFDYDEIDGSYKAISAAEASIALAMNPVIYQGLSNFENGEGKDVLVKLSEDKKLSTINMTSEYTEYGQLYHYDYLYEFSDIGSTSIPDYVVL